MTAATANIKFYRQLKNKKSSKGLGVACFRKFWNYKVNSKKYEVEKTYLN